MSMAGHKEELMLPRSEPEVTVMSLYFSFSVCSRGNQGLGRLGVTQGHNTGAGVRNQIAYLLKAMAQVFSAVCTIDSIKNSDGPILELRN